MIENLKNCPNCGSIIDDFGRCQHCGSKIYDLFDIDCQTYGEKYIRMKTSKGLILAPVILRSATMEMWNQDRMSTLQVEFVITGDLIKIGGDEE